MDDKAPTAGQRVRFERWFAELSAVSAATMGAFVRRFALEGKSAVSIASGLCAEELALAAAGMRVTCIEPAPERLVFAREKTKGQTLAFHALRHQDFESRETFDLIYTSCPDDWAKSSLAAVVPEDYLRFLNRFSHPGSVFVAKLWSSEFTRDVTSSHWFAPAVAERLRRRTPFRLREVWTTATGQRVMLVCTRERPQIGPADGFADWASRFSDPGRLAAAFPEDSMAAPTPVQRLVPYGLRLRHIARRLRNTVRRRVREAQ